MTAHHPPKCNFNHNPILRTPKRKRGQPTKYTQQLADTFCEYVSGGDTLFEAAAKCKIDIMTVYNWQDTHREFFEAMQVSREKQYVSMVEKCGAEVRDKSNDILRDNKGNPVCNSASVGRSKVIADWTAKVLPLLRRNVHLPDFDKCKTTQEMLAYVAKATHDNKIPQTHIDCAMKLVELKIKADEMQKLDERVKQLEAMLNPDGKK